MHFESEFWIDALRAALPLAAFSGFAWALLRTRRQAEEAHAHVTARLDTALVEIRRLSGQLIALGGSIESMEARVIEAQVQAQARALTPVARPAPAAPMANTRGYETAIRMARSGASVDEIVASCGTTRAEAKLLRRLHECGEPRRADAEAQKIA
ncbi:MAG TPA: DUF2802 domain-containing protein [Steroidobacteraceae bacterium]|nr:DUF2802 domain-containing protein [Steroidobacteraceae bacterium]